MSCDRTFVEAIQHFAARPQRYNTQRIRKVVILDFLLAAGAKKRGGSSVDEFALELTGAVVLVLVFANIYLCDAAGSFLFAGYSVVIRSGRRVQHNRMFWSREDSYFGSSPIGCGLLSLPHGRTLVIST